MINHLIVVDGKHVLTASADKTIKRWVAKKDKAQHTFLGHTGPVNKLASLGESLVASASDDKTVRIWDYSLKKDSIHTLEGHESRVTQLAYLRAPCLLASGADDGNVKIWSTEDGFRCLQTLKVGSNIEHLVFLGTYDVVDQQHIGATSPSANAKDPLGLESTTHFKHEDQGAKIEAGDSKHSNLTIEVLLTVSQGSKIKLWDARSGTLTKEFVNSHKD